MLAGSDFEIRAWPFQNMRHVRIERTEDEWAVIGGDEDVLRGSIELLPLNDAQLYALFEAFNRAQRDAYEAGRAAQKKDFLRFIGAQEELR